MPRSQGALPSDLSLPRPTTCLAALVADALRRGFRMQMVLLASSPSRPRPVPPAPPLPLFPVPSHPHIPSPSRPLALFLFPSHPLALPRSRSTRVAPFNPPVIWPSPLSHPLSSPLALLSFAKLAHFSCISFSTSRAKSSRARARGEVALAWRESSASPRCASSLGPAHLLLLDERPSESIDQRSRRRDLRAGRAQAACPCPPRPVQQSARLPRTPRRARL